MEVRNYGTGQLRILSCLSLQGIRTIPKLTYSGSSSVTPTDRERRVFFIPLPMEKVNSGSNWNSLVKNAYARIVS